jgi:hypothetical protein
MQRRSRLDIHLHIYINDYECGGGCPCRTWSQIRQGLGNHAESFFASAGSVAAAAVECGVEYGGSRVIVKVAGVGRRLG